MHDIVTAISDLCRRYVKWAKEKAILYERMSQDKNIIFAEYFNAHFQNGWNRKNISPKNSLPQK